MLKHIQISPETYHQLDKDLSSGVLSFLDASFSCNFRNPSCIKVTAFLFTQHHRNIPSILLDFKSFTACRCEGDSSSPVLIPSLSPYQQYASYVFEIEPCVRHNPQVLNKGLDVCLLSFSISSFFGAFVYLLISITFLSCFPLPYKLVPAVISLVFYTVHQNPQYLSSLNSSYSIVVR